MAELADAARYEELFERSLAQIASLKTRLRALEGGGHEPIAIVGMACRFPGGADSTAEYYRLLCEGRDAIREAPEARGFHSDRQPLPNELRWGGYLDETPGLDPGFFEMSTREAESLDPQQRLLLELAWEALEDAGVDPARGPRDTGVFLGLMHDDYVQRLLREQGPDALEPQIVTGNGHSFACGRLSYFFGFHGPSLATNTACSSSLVAVHLACALLRRRECSLALAGGVNLMLDRVTGSLLAKTGTLSSDGRCRPFDALANGLVRGEGAGLLVLKRLCDAQRDRDRIWAVVRGSAVNQDGRGAGLTAPNAQAQIELIRCALRDAQLPAERVRFVETHGTGTPLGDPIEFEALRATYGAAGERACFLGAVKSNIGHLEAAAGIAGLIKAVLVLRHGFVPKNLNFVSLNPRVRSQGTRLVLAAEACALEPADAPAAAGVSSFGLSGTNAHVILEAYDAAPQGLDVECAEWPLLCVSGSSAESVRALSARYARQLEAANDEEFVAIRRAANVRRARLNERLLVPARERSEALRELWAHARGEGGESWRRHHTPEGWSGGQGRVLVFSGHGSQWPGMGLELMAREPAFARALREVSECVASQTGVRVEQVLRDYGTGSSAELSSAVLQPVLFSLSVSYAALWRSYGYEPDAVIGHSMGEIAASYVCGGLSLEDAARVVCTRGRLLEQVLGAGGMAVVELGLEEASEAVRSYGSRLSVGVNNGPRSVVVSGDEEALLEFEREQGGRGVFVRRVKVDYASHSAHMDALLDALVKELSGLRPERPRIRFESTVGGELSGVPLFSGEYWARNLRQPVWFAGGMERLLRDGHDVFVEVSPHPLLQPSIDEVSRGCGLPCLVVVSSQRERDASELLTESVAQLVAHRVELPLVRSEQPIPHVELPAMSWTREALPAPSSARSPQPLAPGELERLLGFAAPDADHAFLVRVSLRTMPELREHQVDGQVWLPGTAWLELGLRAARAVLADCTTLCDVRLERALVIPAEDDVLCQITVRASARGLQLTFASSFDGGACWTVHGQALACAQSDPSAPGMTWSEQGSSRFDVERFYARREAQALRYGASFRRLLGGQSRPGQAELQMAWRGRSSCGAELDWASLDACLQAAGAAFDACGAAEAAAEDTWVPVGCESFEVVRRPLGELRLTVRTSLRPYVPEDELLIADTELLLPEGSVALRLRGLAFRRLPAAADGADAAPLLHVSWRALEASFAQRNARAPRSLLVLGEASASAFAASCDGVWLARDAGLSAFLTPALRDVVVFAPDAPEHADSASALACALTRVAQVAVRLAGAALRDPPRLWVVTRGAQRVRAVDTVAPDHAAFWGLLRTVALECPELRCTAVDLAHAPRGVSEPSELALLEALITRSPEPDQLALRAGAWLFAQLEHGLPCEHEPPRIDPGEHNYALHVPGAGGLAELSFELASEPSAGPGEVVIECAAAGLNFLDVLRALGALPSEALALPPELGAEAVGRVVAVGPGVGALVPGQRVIALALGALSRRVRVAADLVFPAPSWLPDHEAAGAIVAHATACYALTRAAQVRPGERVLVHAAAGAVGQSAIQWCQQLGAEVLATASSPEKRELLRSLGVSHVFDSRSLRYVEDVRAATRSEGVDVVLNSLGGEHIEASLSLLRDHGRFIELGKRDYLAGIRLGMRPFLRQLRFVLVDLLAMAETRRSELLETLREVVSGLEHKRLRAIATELFPAASVQEAFGRMARAQHLGKSAIALVPAPQVRYRCGLHGIRRDGSYLVTGGLGGLGRSLAAWLATRGAAEVVLVGRSCADEAALTALRRAAPSTSILYERADVADGAALEDVFARIRERGRALRGIFHAAAVLDDAMLASSDAARAELVLRPKVAGALHLDALSRGLPIDLFVLYSSAAALLGSPAQAMYAAANAFLDGLAARRAREGLPALSIAWGPFTQVGLAARDSLRGERLTARGVSALAPEQAFPVLEKLLEGALPQVGVVGLDARRWLDFYPAMAGLVSWHGLLSAARDPAGRAGAYPLQERWRRASTSERLPVLRAWLRGELSRVLRVDAERFVDTRPLSAAGLDSLLGLELRNRIEAASGLRLSVTVLFAHPTISALARYLDQRLSAGSEPPPAAEAPTSVQAEPSDPAAALLGELSALEAVLQ